jgi:hypothetical protein
LHSSIKGKPVGEISDFVGLGIAAVMLIGVSLMPVILLALAVPYAVVRLKAEAPPDSQLGVKVVVHFFFSAAILLMIAGVTMFAVDWMARDSLPNEDTDNVLGRTTLASITAKSLNMTQRIGLGMILGGAIGAGVHALILFFCSDLHRQRIRRTFIGWRFAIHGVVLMFTVTLMIILFLQPEPLRPPVALPLRVVTATHLVWGSSWLLHLALLFDAARRTTSAESMSAVIEARKGTQPAKELIIAMPQTEYVIEAAAPPVWPEAATYDAERFEDAERPDDDAAAQPDMIADDPAPPKPSAVDQHEPPKADPGLS